MEVLFETQLQQIIDGLLRPFAGPVEQGKIQRAFGGHIARRKRFEKFHAAFDVLE